MFGCGVGAAGPLREHDGVTPAEGPKDPSAPEDAMPQWPWQSREPARKRSRTPSESEAGEALHFEDSDFYAHPSAGPDQVQVTDVNDNMVGKGGKGDGGQGVTNNQFVQKVMSPSGSDLPLPPHQQGALQMNQESFNRYLEWQRFEAARAIRESNIQIGAPPNMMPSAGPAGPAVYPTNLQPPQYGAYVGGDHSSYHSMPPSRNSMRGVPTTALPTSTYDANFGPMPFGQQFSRPTNPAPGPMNFGQQFSPPTNSAPTFGTNFAAQFDISTPTPTAPPTTLTFEQQMMLQMVDLMKSNNEAAGSSKRELQGVKHNIALPTLVKINYTNDIAKDAQSYQNWWTRFETYILRNAVS